MDRGNNIVQKTQPREFEHIPENGVAVVRGEDRYIQNSNKISGTEELKEEVRRADEYREQEGYDAFYFVVGRDGARDIRTDGNYYVGDEDLEDVADLKITSEGLEKL